MFLQNLMEQFPVFVIHRDAVRGRGIVIAAPLVPKRPGGNDDAAVLNIPVQYTAVSEQNQLLLYSSVPYVWVVGYSEKRSAR